MNSRATVIIPTYEGWDDLQRCVELLKQQSVSLEVFEIIIVNNAETDEVPSDFRLPANARIIWEPKPGSYAARNAGIMAAKTDLWFFTDSDCRPRADYIENGLKAFDSNPQIERFAGAVELEPAGDKWTIPEVYDRVTALNQEFYATEGRAATANVFARRSAFDKVGLFDDQTMSGGDMEWARRAIALGIELLYVPDVVVGHPARASFEEHAVKRRRILAAQIRYATPQKLKKYYRIPIRRFLFPSVVGMRVALRQPDLNCWEAIQLSRFQNKIRRLQAREQVRLTWLKGQPERR